MNNKPKFLCDCKNSKGLFAFMEGKAEKHTEYCHYTRLGTIDIIIGNGELWLSASDNFNDKNDKADEGIFSFCFSTGTAENLALWYLYSGVDGKGGRIRFTKNNVEKLKKESKLFLCEKDREQTETGIELTRGIDVDVSIKDVIYIKQKEKNCDIRYNNETNFEIPSAEYELIKNSKMFFVKKTVWYHEKETRLVAELTDEGKKLLKPGTKYVVVLKMPESLRKRIKIEFAPEIVKSDLGFLNKYSEIKKYMENSGNVKFSKFSGEVEMRLLEKICKNCKKGEM